MKPKLPDSASNTAIPWHSLEIEKALEVQGSNPDTGLTSKQTSELLHQYGTNELQEFGGRKPLSILIDQFTNIMLVMLMAVAVVSAILDLRSGDFPKDAIAISFIVILNGLLGFVQESRAEKALAALKRLSSPRVRVLRDSKIFELSAKELVPGDIVFLETGMQAAADGRLLEAQNLQVMEAALTGEAEAVHKDSTLDLPEDASLGDRINMVYQGTEVVQGRAKMLVTATGMQTELGKIAALLQSVEAQPTPLQQRMSQLANVLVISSLALVAVVIIGGIVRTGSFQHFDQLLKVSLSMAVAVVPEGLPAVITVTLAIGTQRMVRHQALIRKLPAVETLGSVTTICSDKTGTLTQNKMVVQQINISGNTIRVTGDGYAPTGTFELSTSNQDKNIKSIEPKDYPELEQLLFACVLCNDAVLQKKHSEWEILGDPTEGALLSVAGKAGMQQAKLLNQFTRIAEFPFSSERKRMSVICQRRQTELTQILSAQEEYQAPDSQLIMFTKGSPELILELCTSYYVGTKSSFALNDEKRAYILEQNNQMASQGLRVLGFAYKPLDTVPTILLDEKTTERELIWIGLVGMLDAPRPEAKQAVAQCQQAGIRPIMITGDHQLTAQAIAYDLGIAKPGDLILSGQELEKLSAPELEQQVNQVSIYARVSPEHKLRIVEALKNQGKLVAMTGDGVNDAPALKQANIGVAMGITGTDVSKEASDMILLDDNFATIIRAIEEGRVVYDNIRRFIKYILGSNIGEVLTVAAASLIGLGETPLSPLQILWMNLVTDGLPALALAMESPEPDVMNRPPYNPHESIFARGLGFYIIRIGIIIALITIALMAWAYNYTKQSGDPERWKTMVFTTLCLAQMGHALAIRSNTQLTIQLNPFSNPYLLAAISLTTVLQLMLIYVAPLRSFFNTHLLSLPELAICIGCSALVFVWIELEKLFIKHFRQERKITYKISS
ncbi:cation-transporting P-type ATPase [Rivularia sp. IAM M-261]|nr:cation-transporting P-type ATPase [Rivularia sp. IAM M-261]